MAKGVTVRMWRRSIFVLIILVGGGFGTIAIRLIQLQLIQGTKLQQMAIDQQLKDTTINAQRGTIYDRNMKPLAQSATVWTVVLEPAYLKSEKEKELIADGLSQILGIDKQELLKDANKKSYYVTIKRKIENDIKDKIIEFQKTSKIRAGIRLIEDYKRYYPYGSFASHEIGFTGSDGQGLSGIENYYDNELMGIPGRLVTARNAVGTDMPFEHEEKIAAKNGHSLVLTIDEGVQHILEKYLEEGRINNNVINGATAILMDVNNGEILGMATKNDFDLNAPFDIINEEEKKKIDSLPQGEERSKIKNEALQKQWRNKGVSDTYMPGSVFKMVTASMGLEENLVNEESRFFCSGSVVPYKGASPVHCHKRTGHGSLNFSEAICHSCNSAFIAVGQRIGPELFYKHYKDFGLTQKTGIDLPGETNGIFFNKDGSMAPMDLAVASFGQNFTITPVQMISAIAAVANRGKLVRPHLVKQIIDEFGNIVKTTDTSIRRHVISEETSKRMCRMLQRNVEIGSGKNAYTPGWRIAGKTGTSEKIGHSRDGKKDYIASFGGFCPAEGPQFVLIVLYDTPTGQSYYGSQVAAPVFAKIGREIWPLLGLEKKYTEQELAALDIPTPSLIGLSISEAKQKLALLGLNPRTCGSGQKVTSQIPEAGAKIPKEGTVVLYTDQTSSEQKVAVPNFVGLAPAAVNKLAAAARLNIHLSGAARAQGEVVVSVSQNIKEGTQVKPGTVVTVEFVQKDSIH